MQDFRKVAPTFWTGKTGRAIRAAGPETQVVALYLITCPSASWLGVFYLPLPTMCHETGLTQEGASKALGRLSEAGFAYYDEATEYVWIPEMARHQIGERLAPKDNKISGIVKNLEQLRKCPFARPFYLRYRELFNLPNMPEFAAEPEVPGSPLEDPPRPLRSTETETETETETDQHHSGADAPSGRARNRASSTTSKAIATIAPAGFDSFYSIYPRKIARAKALKAWKKINPDPDLQARIMAAVEDQKGWPTWTKDGGQYIPYPATWLNDCHWEDECPSKTAPTLVGATRRTADNLSAAETYMRMVEAGRS
jgi:hypothetical protein